MISRHLPAVFAALLAFAPLPTTRAADQPLVPVRMSDNGDFLIPLLADQLGYFKDEGIKLVRVKVEEVAPNDFMFQKPLNEGKIDASYHWFHHTLFGMRHNYPVVAVAMFADAPGMKIMVANQAKDQIRSAADFRGRKIAEGAGYSTKGVITEYLARRAGLPKGAYDPVFPEEAGRQKHVLAGLDNGGVDVVSFMEPLSSLLLSAHKVTTIYDLTDRKGTVGALGAAFPSESLIVAPAMIKDRPDLVQHLVNATVRAMRYLNSHEAKDVAAHLPPEYFASGREAAERFVAATLPNYAVGNYAFSPKDVQLIIDIALHASFDQTEEGVWRATVENPTIDRDALYDNRFVEQAMKTIP